jgi:hypothetical protein
MNYYPEQLAIARRQKSVTGNGVAFLEWLEGPKGCGFALLREGSHSDDDIAAAKRWLRNTRDCVIIQTWRPT